MSSQPRAALPSFDNTEIAFRSKSDGALRRAHFLFRLIGNPALVKVGSVLTQWAVKLHLPIGWAIKGTIFRQFCGGETISECADATLVLDRFRIGTILDYSVEGKDSEADLDETKEEICRTLTTSKGNENIPFCVFKVTGVARFELLEKVNAKEALSREESAEWERAVNRVEAICRLAYGVGTPVFIDAEDSWIQDAIDDLADTMMAKYNKSKAIVYNTIQMYRHDRLAFFEASYKKAVEQNYFLGVKLVRGAYMEKERVRAVSMGYQDPIQPNKEASDRDFDRALLFAIQHVDRISICCGSHNENSSLYLARLMDENDIARNDKRIFFAQLFGMSDHISFNLADAGYNVAKYVPYGPIREVLPYLIRRAQENTSVKGQTGRELSLIQKEVARRKGH